MAQYSHLFQNFPVYCDPHKGFGIVNKAPFAALSGYDDMISEEARPVDRRIELSEDDLDLLNRKLRVISDAVAEDTKPEVFITYFIPDPLKAGGRYETVKEKIRKVDTAAQEIILMKKTGKAGSFKKIGFRDVLDLRGDLLDELT